MPAKQWEIHHLFFQSFGSLELGQWTPRVEMSFSRCSCVLLITFAKYPFFSNKIHWGQTLTNFLLCVRYFAVKWHTKGLKCQCLTWSKFVWEKVILRKCNQMILQCIQNIQNLSQHNTRSLTTKHPKMQPCHQAPPLHQHTRTPRKPHRTKTLQAWKKTDVYKLLWRLNTINRSSYKQYVGGDGHWLSINTSKIDSINLCARLGHRLALLQALEMSTPKFGTY